MQSLFCDMNTKFGNPVMTTPSPQEFDRLSKQIHYSLDELKELADATTEYDRADALADTVVFLKGFRHMAGAKDDFTTNIAIVCNFLDMIEPGTSDKIMVSDYPIHDVFNILKQKGIGGTMQEFEDTMRDAGPSSVAMSFIDQASDQDLKAFSDHLQSAAKALIDVGVQAAANGDIAGAMFVVDKAIALIYIVCTHVDLNLDVVLASVYQSNMTKFCIDQDMLDATIKSYADKGIVVVPDDNTQFPNKVVRSPVDQTVEGKLYSAGKFLKSVSFKEPDFKLESCRCF